MGLFDKSFNPKEDNRTISLFRRYNPWSELKCGGIYMNNKDRNIRKKQYCWHNPSDKASPFARFFDFFFHMNRLRFNKDYTGKCANCEKPISPIILTNPGINVISLVLFYVLCFLASFLSVWFAIRFSFNVILVLLGFCCPLLWLIRRIIHSAVFGFFRWESYTEETFNIELRWLQVETRVKIELLLCMLAFAGGGFLAAVIFI